MPSLCLGSQVEGLLDRAAGSGAPVVQYIVEQLERLGYQSWAQRILSTAGHLFPFFMKNAASCTDMEVKNMHAANP